MGTLTYDGATIEFPDRLLAHLQIVIVTKLRRREGFAMTWQHPEDLDDGRSAIWLDASIPLHFTFDGPRPAAMSREWLSKLTDTANANTGLLVLDEGPEREEALEGAPRVKRVSEYT
ncbi:DUF7882 family protein [Leifsonia poae]|uniref:DUF7882 domain-containing protein n=1 Tax=Leifsonia poae TaxID=110933 RepID=A0A9W6H6J5_9MICO|nr:ATP-dependent DNA ligase [Leifsonia poae]GLJ74886.1 hypothetical protein GCM10017584_04590 [Leifsonia poae]